MIDTGVYYRAKGVHRMRKRWRGSGYMQQRARELRKATTPEETILWKVLSRRQVHGAYFRRQYPIGTFVVDFYCAEAKLAIEIDGSIHERQETLDTMRTEWLQDEKGVRVLRFTNQAIRERLDEVIQRITEALLHSQSADK